MDIISIIIPIFDVEDYLPKCIDSVLSQTFKDFELILVDDGSPDNCGRICDEYAEKDGRIKVIHQKNGGLSAARNTGLDWATSKSNTDWIFFVDSDDWIVPTCLEQLYDACINNNVLIASGAHSRDLEQVKQYNRFVRPVVLSIEDFYAQKDYYKFPILSACCKLFKKSLFNGIRFPIGKLCEDRFTTYKLFFQTDKIACITEPLYYYLIRDESISHKNWSPKLLDDIEACEEQLSFFEEKNYPIAYKRIANNYLTVTSIYIKNIRETGLPQYKEYYSYLKNLLRKNLKRFKNVVPKDIGLLCYRDAFFDNKKPLTVIYYTLYMLVIYGPKKTIWKIKNREK